jgi:hypothetical protein
MVHLPTVRIQVHESVVHVPIGQLDFARVLVVREVLDGDGHVTWKTVSEIVAAQYRALVRDAHLVADTVVGR